MPLIHLECSFISTITTCKLCYCLLYHFLIKTIDSHLSEKSKCLSNKHPSSPLLPHKTLGFLFRSISPPVLSKILHNSLLFHPSPPTRLLPHSQTRFPSIRNRSTPSSDHPPSLFLYLQRIDRWIISRRLHTPAKCVPCFR